MQLWGYRHRQCRIQRRLNRPHPLTEPTRDTRPVFFLLRKIEILAQPIAHQRLTAPANRQPRAIGHSLYCPDFAVCWIYPCPINGRNSLVKPSYQIDRLIDTDSAALCRHLMHAILIMRDVMMCKKWISNIISE